MPQHTVSLNAIGMNDPSIPQSPALLTRIPVCPPMMIIRCGGFAAKYFSLVFSFDMLIPLSSRAWKKRSYFLYFNWQRHGMN